ncbi:MAG: hypothetical protein V3U92_04520 [Cellulophaga sp.]
MNADVRLKVSGNTKAIPVVILEHLDFKNVMRFKNGEWSKTFLNFPIDTDKKLDFALLCAGIPFQECKVTVTIRVGNKTKSKESTDIFGPKGWAIIKDELKL